MKERLVQIINRHLARTLTNLEDVDCPATYIKEVKSGFQWLRSDVEELCENKGNK